MNSLFVEQCHFLSPAMLMKELYMLWVSLLFYWIFYINYAPSKITEWVNSVYILCVSTNYLCFVAPLIWALDICYKSLNYHISSNKSLLWINASLDYKPGCLNIVENKCLVSSRSLDLYSKPFLIAGSSRKWVQVKDK